MAEEKKKKKIIVDEDWKQQAREMKEKDAKTEEAAEKAKEQKAVAETGPSASSGQAGQAPSTGSEQAGQAPSTDSGQAGERHLPPGDFAGLVNILVSQSLFLLGMLVEKGQETREPDLPLAKYHIDMLVSLEAKTKGNLTDEEDKMLQSVLQQLRMAFVDLSSKAAGEGEK